VVDQRYVPAKAGDDPGEETTSGFVPLAADGAGVESGGYLSVVTHGAFRWVRVDADADTTRMHTPSKRETMWSMTAP
jgi:hypothetical protein